MPRYRFVGDFETVLHGLAHGVNATLHRAKHGQPDGSTLVVHPGDEITTKNVVPHPLLAEVKTTSDRKPRAPRKTAAKKTTAKAKQAEEPTPASEGADQA